MNHVVDLAGVAAAQAEDFRLVLRAAVQLAILPRPFLLRSSLRFLLGKKLFLVLCGAAYALLPQEIVGDILRLAGVGVHTHDLVHVGEIRSAGIRRTVRRFPGRSR